MEFALVRLELDTIILANLKVFKKTECFPWSNFNSLSRGDTDEARNQR